MFVEFWEDAEEPSPLRIEFVFVDLRECLGHYARWRRVNRRLGRGNRGLGRGTFCTNTWMSHQKQLDDRQRPSATIGSGHRQRSAARIGNGHRQRSRSFHGPSRRVRSRSPAGASLSSVSIDAMSVSWSLHRVPLLHAHDPNRLKRDSSSTELKLRR